jgi:glucose/arabinose dehydrogenase
MGGYSGTRQRRWSRPLFLIASLALALAACTPVPPPSGGTFIDEIVFGGLTNPTAVRFAPDGRVFVAEKSGIIKVFDSLTDTTPTVFANLRTQVHNYWDRGLLGLALDPEFPEQPWVYVAYTRDAPVGGSAPTWGTADALSDPCPTPPGPTADGCVVSGRVSRLEAAGNVMTGPEHVLIDDWCQQYPSHSVGTLTFGPDGALYASGGDGASFTFLDYGQRGSPPNPCGDAPVPVGTAQTVPSAEGGALRSQDLRTPADPTSLDGTIIRVDRATGEALPDNPLASSTDPNQRRIVADGLRNPFRITFRPGTNELWVGDVGSSSWEEIERVVNPIDEAVENFGWPCYEGGGRQPSWDAADLTLCENLYAAGSGAVVQPSFAYSHQDRVDPNDSCEGGGSVTGVAFMPPNSVSYPAEYRGALFFADYSRQCIWVVPLGAGGQPDFAQRRLFRHAPEPVDLQLGPDNNLYYVDHGGTVRRIRYDAPPQAVISASPTYGAVPLTVQFDGTASYDPGGGPITYAWDLDGDGAFDDSTSPSPSYTYTESQDYTARLKVTDSAGASGEAAVVISAGNTPPTAIIDTPAVGTTWAVGDTIGFSGHATDAEQGTLPDSALTWALVLHHCPSTCHVHNLETFSSTSSGSFVAPDHDYPSHLELRLTATDARGLKNTTSVRLDPRTVTLTLESQPSGLTLAAGATTQTAPFTLTVIERSTISVSAPSPQTLDGTNYVFASWSDLGPQTHDIVVSSNSTLTAVYLAQVP